jgi:hypothetical protein
MVWLVFAIYFRFARNPSSIHANRGDHFLQVLQADYFGSYRIGSSLKWREGRARDQLEAWRGESPMVPRNQHQVSARACGLWTKCSSSLRESCQRFAELIAGDTDSTAALSDRLAICTGTDRPSS